MQFVNNSYQQNSRVLYTFVLKRSFGQLWDISHKNVIFLTTFEFENKYQVSHYLNYNISKMTRYSVQPRDWLFVKGYGLLWFAKNMGKNVSKSLSSKYSQKLLDHSKQFATNVFKTYSKKAIQKTA